MRARSFQLTAALVAAHAGAAVVCLDESAIGRSYELYAQRPGPRLNERLTRAGLRSEVINAPGLGEEPEELEEEAVVMLVTIRGPIEQRATRRDSGCGGGWTDGYDAITERVTAALEQGDVALVIDSPGGACAGIQEAIDRMKEAKAEHGRRVVAYADECAASAAYWLAATVADEIYLPRLGAVGSIGARASHQSIAGMLEQAGVEVTHFAWPGEGKIAFASEQPLSDLGRERGERDVAIAGEAFAADIASARGLSRDEIVALAADCLTGRRAVKAGLADGVASLDEVLMMLVDRNENQEREMPAKKSEEEREDEEAMDENEDAQDDEPEAHAEDEDEEAEDDDEAEDEDDDEEEEEAEEEEPKATARAQRSRRAKARAPKSLAELAGVRPGASMPAITSALYPLVSLAKHVMRETGSRTPAAARGALKALVEDAGRAGELATKLSAQRRQNNARERRDLLKKLQAADIHPRGDLFVDVIDAKTGKRSTKPAPLWAKTPLATLRQYVATKLEGAAPASSNVRRSRDPFQPDDARLERGGSVTAEDKQIAQKHGYDPKRVAAARNAIFNGASRGA